MRVIRLESTTSTQDAARGQPIGTVVVADSQTRGRGRLDRAWEAAPGSALLASFVLPPRPLASLAAGVATAEACGTRARLKWPNDVLLDGGKLAGILIEADAGRCVVGVGVNLTDAPVGAAQLGPDASRDALLERLGAGLQRWWEAADAAILVAWRERADTLGRQVRVELPGESFEGVAEAITGDGALLVSGRVVVAGDVIHLRVAPGAGGSRPPGP
ncbi:MAG: biotin--[acetyl-CoA-carboxylase] ligase [Candidatus Dormibacteraeota bacterium]|nr:biotin--[acetyl-CoA-carboxylase] ligase [Candidatus Dormibacteraeota bacterium]